MSSAFTRENDENGSIEDIGERPVSPHRNLVTPEASPRSRRNWKPRASLWPKRNSTQPSRDRARRA